LVLVVQNDAPRGDMGVATSTATFFRSVGGAFGVAVFGAIFAARLSLPDVVKAQVGSGMHIDPARAKQLPPHVHDLFLNALPHALHSVFLYGTLLSLVPFALAWLLEEVPLRDTLQPATAAG